jgi:hypothetical protein
VKKRVFDSYLHLVSSGNRLCSLSLKQELNWTGNYFGTRHETFRPFRPEDIDESVNGPLNVRFASFAKGRYFGGAQRGEGNEKIQA